MSEPRRVKRLLLLLAWAVVVAAVCYWLYADATAFAPGPCDDVHPGGVGLLVCTAPPTPAVDVWAYAVVGAVIWAAGAAVAGVAARVVRAAQ